MKRGFLIAAVAVLLVALGIGIGAGPLQLSQSRKERDLDRERATTARLQGELERQRARAEFADAYVEGTAPAVVKDALAGRTFNMVLLPGATTEDTAKVQASMVAAGARLVGSVQLAESAVSASGRQLVDALTSQMATQTPDVTVPAEATAFQRLGLLLGRAIGAPAPAGAAYDTKAVAIVAGLTSAKVATVVEPVTQRAGLVVAIAGPPLAGDADPAENAASVQVLTALSGQVATVAGGQSTAAGPRGLLGAIRDDATGTKALSTVGGLDTPMGPIIAVLAARERLAGGIGHYGPGDAPDGALPKGSRG